MDGTLKIQGNADRCQKCNLDKTVMMTVNAGPKWVCVCCEIWVAKWPCGHK